MPHLIHKQLCACLIFFFRTLWCSSPTSNHLCYGPDFTGRGNSTYQCTMFGILLTLFLFGLGYRRHGREPERNNERTPTCVSDKAEVHAVLQSRLHAFHIVALLLSLDARRHLALLALVLRRQSCPWHWCCGRALVCSLIGEGLLTVHSHPGAWSSSSITVSWEPCLLFYFSFLWHFLDLCFLGRPGHI